MVKYIIILLFISITCRAQEVYLFTSFHEPANEGLRFLYSYDGYHWTSIDTIFLKPSIGKQKVMRDPSIVLGPDGTFHLVWTSSWRGDLGFGYSSSKDLIHWKEQKLIEVMTFDTSTVNVWAPELFYDKTTQQFVIVWSSTVPYRFTKGIEDEMNNHRMYYTTTKDFNTFAQTKLFFDPGYSVIDGTIIKDSIQKYILVFKDNTRPNRNLKVAFSDNATGPFSNISDSFTGFLTEGPSAVKVGNDWLIYYDAYDEKIYRAAKTNDFKTFSDVTKAISVPTGHKHGTIFKVDKKILLEMLKFSGKY
jgi:hypothetical protein